MKASEAPLPPAAALGPTRTDGPPAALPLQPRIGGPYCPPSDGPTLCHVDARLVVADKPSGLLSVPGRGDHKADCVLSRVAQHIPDVLTVHRLDLGTSGLIVLARGAAMQRALSMAFERRQVGKAYEAWVAGLPAADEGRIELPLRLDWPRRPLQIVDPQLGKPALTHWHVLARDAERGITRLRLEPVTGRSHQLRVHLASIGHPILGDELYAPPPVQAAAPRLMLHACMLALPAVGTMPQALRVDSPAPF